ncbi:triacylglycerol lipase [Entomortierella parvispora]|uniref:Triacylglycerol lipase n=1 Tax=Entomortierella parvispora TaxID=205924 RepID=A0A9P3HJA1_9FUNG|nr:triacylglycerol lipase [Entomortierella parvispora]
MLVNTTSFLLSHLRSTLSATANSTSAAFTSIKTSLGLVGAKSGLEKNKGSSASTSSASSSLSSSSPSSSNVSYSREVEMPKHEQYPSLQPWRGLDRRIKNYGYTMPISPNYTAPRHPIVLCHGLFGFDKMGPEGIPHLQIHYWSGIEKALTQLGAKVIVAGVPRTGAIKKRAEDLHRMLSASMEGVPVNFLAHSMGGLDCRYLISHIKDKNYHVQSLTTLSTPHRGSPMMDWFRDNLGVGLRDPTEEEAMRQLGEAARASRAAVQEASNVMQRLMENATEAMAGTTQAVDPFASPIGPLLSRLVPLLDTPAYRNLTTNYCQEVFNPNTPDDPSVKYYSYGASVKQMPIWAPLGFAWEIIKAKEGENDGLVSLSSARWGEYVETVECDHWDLNNRKRIKLGAGQKAFDAVELYMNVATRLYKEGY